nr:MAG TPA: hypothetical protein [Caudoviricetes sp.]
MGGLLQPTAVKGMCGHCRQDIRGTEGLERQRSCKSRNTQTLQTMNIVQALKAIFDLLKKNYETVSANNKYLEKIYESLTTNDISFTDTPDEGETID